MGCSRSDNLRTSLRNRAPATQAMHASARPHGTEIDTNHAVLGCVNDGEQLPLQNDEFRRDMSQRKTEYCSRVPCPSIAEQVRRRRPGSVMSYAMR